MAKHLTDLGQRGTGLQQVNSQGMSELV